MFPLKILNHKLNRLFSSQQKNFFHCYILNNISSIKYKQRNKVNEYIKEKTIYEKKVF